MKKKVKFLIVLLFLVMSNILYAQRPNQKDIKIKNKLLKLKFNSIEKSNITVDSLVRLIKLPVIDTFYLRTNPAILDGIKLCYSNKVILDVEFDEVISCNRFDFNTWEISKLFDEKVAKLRLKYNSKVIKE